MEVATADKPAVANPPIEGLPPGPDWSLPRSTARWWRKPLQTLDYCQARYGDMFTYRLPYEGRWVFVSDPEAIKQVFTGDPRLLHAGEANIVLLPVLGEHSVLLLDEPQHMQERKLMLPSFHGQRMKAYGDVMAGGAVEEIERWTGDESVRMRPRMQAMTLEIILRAVFGVDEGERLNALRDQLRRTLNPISPPKRAIFMATLAPGPAAWRPSPPSRRRWEGVNKLLYEDFSPRGGAPALSERDDILSLLLQA